MIPCHVTGTLLLVEDPGDELGPVIGMDDVDKKRVVALRMAKSLRDALKVADAVAAASRAAGDEQSQRLPAY